MMYSDISAIALAVDTAVHCAWETSDSVVFLVAKRNISAKRQQTMNHV